MQSEKETDDVEFYLAFIAASIFALMLPTTAKAQDVSLTDDRVHAASIMLANVSATDAGYCANVIKAYFSDPEFKNNSPAKQSQFRVSQKITGTLQS